MVPIFLGIYFNHNHRMENNSILIPLRTRLHKKILTLLFRDWKIEDVTKLFKMKNNNLFRYYHAMEQKLVGHRRTSLILPRTIFYLSQSSRILLINCLHSKPNFQWLLPIVVTMLNKN